MKKEIINIENAPKAVGPYSQGVIAGNTFYFSGQIAINPQTGKLDEGDEVSQTVQIFSNIKNLLDSQNLRFENIVKTTVFITDISKFSEINKEYAKYFLSNPPARSCVEVTRLPLGAKVEIEFIAVK